MASQCVAYQTPHHQPAAHSTASQGDLFYQPLARMQRKQKTCRAQLWQRETTCGQDAVQSSAGLFPIVHFA